MRRFHLQRVCLLGISRGTEESRTYSFWVILFGTVILVGKSPRNGHERNRPPPVRVRHLPKQPLMERRRVQPIFALPLYGHSLALTSRGLPIIGNKES